MHAAYLEAMQRAAVTRIEHALIAGAYRIANGTTPDGVIVPAELDCMTQAMHETCRRFGMSSDEAARFMLSLARCLKQLQPDVEQRLELRRVERQMHAAITPDEPGATPAE
jgi:hypothetical protein